MSCNHIIHVLLVQKEPVKPLAVLKCSITVVNVRVKKGEIVFFKNLFRTDNFSTKHEKK